MLRHRLDRDFEEQLLEQATLAETGRVALACNALRRSTRRTRAAHEVYVHEVGPCEREVGYDGRARARRHP